MQKFSRPSYTTIGSTFLKKNKIIISPPVWVQSIVISVSVCLFVCRSVCSHISKTTRLSFTKFSIHVTCGRGSVLHLRQYNTLFNSGFVDDVTFSQNTAIGPE